MRSLRKERPLVNRLIYSALAGLTLGYVIISWGAEKYLVSLLALLGFKFFFKEPHHPS
jgi:asparagine N-glycosylation enzyme membrane subunit Stt3